MESIDMLDRVQESYVTKDLTEAASLVSCGHRTIGMNVYLKNRGGAIGHFQFARTEEMENDRDLYNSSRMAVEPRSFMANYRKLKSAVECAYSDLGKQVM